LARQIVFDPKACLVFVFFLSISRPRCLNVTRAPVVVSGRPRALQSPFYQGRVTKASCFLLFYRGNAGATSIARIWWFITAAYYRYWKPWIALRWPWTSWVFNVPT